MLILLHFDMLGVINILILDRADPLKNTRISMSTSLLAHHRNLMLAYRRIQLMASL